MSCARTAKPIDLPFGLWTRVCQRKHKFNCICQVAPMCPHGKAHWHHLANTIQPSICGSDVVLCQIALTTCSLYVVDKAASRILAERTSKEETKTRGKVYRFFFTTTTVLWPFFWDHPGEPVPEGNFWNFYGARED